jgi:UDP-glucuronate 4-epimerase
MKILVTGSAGFIGFHVAKRLLVDGHQVIGLDNLNEYYDVNLKKARLNLLNDYSGYSHHSCNLQDKEGIESLFATETPESVVHLAAQAGVRYSIQHPHEYVQSNVVGFLNILEGCRNHPVKHLVFASTSSVYGLNRKYPFATTDSANHPVSLYAATKKDNEVTAHSYSHLFGIPSTGLRFFTVYGPWGRPDMALFLFTKNILAGKPIDVFNRGNMARDFTYIDDIVEGIIRIVAKPPVANVDWDANNPNPSNSSAPYHLYNIGSNSPVALMDFIREIEKNLALKAQINFLPMQPGDFQKSHADVSGLVNDFGYQPKFNIETGVKNFIDWYTSYYKS